MIKNDAKMSLLFKPNRDRSVYNFVYSSWLCHAMLDADQEILLQLFMKKFVQSFV